MIDKTEQEVMKNWKGDTEIPLLSICTISYNHEKYIAEALDSFLIQETDFPFEIVIDDDCSPDGTANIIEQYIEKYPNIINANLRKINVGMMKNFTECEGYSMEILVGGSSTFAAILEALGEVFPAGIAVPAFVGGNVAYRFATGRTLVLSS